MRKEKKSRPTATAVDPILLKVMGTETTRSDQRKTEIIQAAIDCIATDGVENASYDAIGKRIGMGRAHVAYYFKDKGELIRTAIHYVLAKGQEFTVQKILGAQTTEERVRAFVEGAFDYAASDKSAMAVYMLYFYYCVVDQEYASEHAVARKMGADRISAVLASDPRVSAKFKPTEIARIGKTIQLLVTGGVIEFLTASEPRVASASGVEEIREETVQSALSLLF
jgi:AcrR family transcriptional regulator